MAQAKVTLADGERIFTEHRTATFRKEPFDYIHTGIIDNAGDTWTTTALDEVNIAQIYNQYRVRHGIPFPDEIIALRKYYGLSAAKMSEVLGFGINQYRLYENGEIPSTSNARILIAIRDKQTFLDFLEASRDVIGEKDFSKIHSRISSQADYLRPTAMPGSLTGFVAHSPEKLAATVKYFINSLGGVFVTKMNKLLFYTDFLCYRRKGYGITGLRYKAMQYGPVPDNWGKTYNSIPDVYMDEYVLPDMSSGIKLNTAIAPDMTVFDEVESNVLSDIATRFKSTNAGEISKISHSEKGWIENHLDKGYIDYAYAFDLSIT